MNEEELKQALISLCVAVNDALDEIIRELQENLPTFEMYEVRPPEEIKKQIKYEKNPMRLKQLNRELNDSYKVYRKKRKWRE